MGKKICRAVLPGILLVLMAGRVAADVQYRWSKLFGEAQDEQLAAVQPVPGRGVVAAGWITSAKTNSSGKYHRDLWVVSLNNDGVKQWDRVYGRGGDEEAAALAVLPDGGCVAAGYTTGISNGSARPLLIRIAGNGAILWLRDYTDAGSGRAAAVIRSGRGFMLGGSVQNRQEERGWLRRVDNAGRQLWVKQPGGNGRSAVLGLHPLSGGGAVLSGWKAGAKDGLKQGWVAAVDAAGRVVWEQTAGSNWQSVFHSVTVNSDGTVVAAGESSLSNEQPDMLVAGYSADGKQLWQYRYGGPKMDRALQVINSGNGGYIISGETSSYGKGLSNGWLMMLNTQGEKVWSKIIGGNKRDTLAGVASARDGWFTVAGTTTSYGKGGSDMMVISLQRFGEEVWDRTAGSGGVFSMLQLRDRGFVFSGVRREQVHGSLVPVPVLEKLASDGQPVWRVLEPQKGTAYTVFQLTNGDLLSAGRLAAGEDFRPLAVRVSTNGKRLVRYGYPPGIETDSAFLGGCALPDGGFVLTGFVLTGWYQTRDLLVCRYDRNGKLLWHRVLGGKRDDIGFCAVPAPDGGVLVGGVNYSRDRHGEGYFLRFDKNGEILWEKTYGSRGFDSVNALTVRPDSENGVLFCGTSGRDRGARLWVGGIDWTGKMVWQSRYGSSQQPAQGSGLVYVKLDQSFLAYGTRDNKLYLVKVAGDGRLAWDRVHGTAARELGTAVLIAGDGTTVTAAVRYGRGDEPFIWLKKWF